MINITITNNIEGNTVQSHFHCQTLKISNINTSKNETCILKRLENRTFESINYFEKIPKQFRVCFHSSCIYEHRKETKSKHTGNDYHQTPGVFEYLLKPGEQEINASRSHQSIGDDCKETLLKKSKNWNIENLSF